MKKTSVYLTQDQVDRLKRIARAEQRSEAEVVRAAIDSYPEPASKRRILAYKVGRGPGGSIADIPEEEYLKGFGEDSLGGERIGES
jgi:hypothetical protein